MNEAELEVSIKKILTELLRDSVVKLKIHGVITDEAIQVLSAPALRSLAPPTMNVNATPVDYPYYATRRSRPLAS